MDTTFFVIKKVFGHLLLPLGLSLILGGLGWSLLRRGSGSRLGRRLVGAGLLFLLLPSLPLVARLLLTPLERAAGDYADPANLARAGVSEVVVLGGGLRHGRRGPVDRLSQASLERLVEGIRLWRALPGASLTLSGGGFGAVDSEAEAMARVAAIAEVPRGAMVLESGSWDTMDQARNLARRLKGRPFALVTEASHMPRALFIFRRYGMDPVAAPVHFRARGPWLGYSSILPSAGGLSGSERAFYEYLGLAWAWLRSQGGLPAPPPPQDTPIHKPAPPGGPAGE